VLSALGDRIIRNMGNLMKCRVIGLAGPAHCGKNTASTVISALMPAYKEMSFADPLKQMLITGLALTREQVYGDKKEEVDSRYGCTPRHMMQTLGTEWGRALIGPDVWMLAMQQHLHPYTIITDVRFENEAAFVRERGILIHIHRAVRIGEEHLSEKGVEIKEGDIVVQNHGTLHEFYATMTSVVDARLR